MNFILAVLLCFTCFSVVAKDLHEVLERSNPVEEGTCRVYLPKHGMMTMECIRGMREDGVSLYAIKEDNVIIAVYEQVGDQTPKQIWGADWRDI